MRTLFSGMFCLILGLGCFVYCRWGPAAGSKVESQWLKGDTLLIRLSDGTGWLLDIYREGGGNIRYGRHPNNTLTFDRGGFNFDSLRRSLANNPSKEKKVSFYPARIAYLLSDEKDATGEVLTNLELGQELFDRAFEAGLNGNGDLRAKRRMLKIFKTNPPFATKIW